MRWPDRHGVGAVALRWVSRQLNRLYAVPSGLFKKRKPSVFNPVSMTP